MNVVLILGNQLFDPDLILARAKEIGKPLKVFMREDRELCTYYRFHKHKIVFFLAAMREYAQELRKAGIDVHYEELDQSGLSYEGAFLDFLEATSAERVFHYEIEDKFFEQRISRTLSERKTKAVSWRSPMFLTSREQFSSYASKTKKPFMRTFYEAQRKRLKVLVDSDGQPVGGRWSFDEDNRLALPDDLSPPALPSVRATAIVKYVAKVCEERFPDHPGDANTFWLPVDRAGARDWLQHFLKERLANFGPYEDALSPKSTFIFHSVLTPFLNVGLLTPEDVVKETLRHARAHEIPLASLEGFIRQVIGWREFVRGIYRSYSDKQEASNFFGHQKRLTRVWYTGDTGVPPLDAAISKALDYGYAHHIERLMVLGNLMLLLEVHPKEAHRWFMEMFIDSSDWVMGPNVYGMALFSDGGIFATKPYICGSNYFRKMGGYKKGDWCDGVDGLYWGFVEKHKSWFLKNPRLAMMARSVEKMDSAKKKRLALAADQLRKRLVMD